MNITMKYRDISKKTKEKIRKQIEMKIMRRLRLLSSEIKFCSQRMCRT